MLSLLVPEPWKAGLVAEDMFHQLLWLDVSKQLKIPISPHTS